MLADTHARFRSSGRDALLGGWAVHDRPLTDGGHRWGLSAVLRPAGPELSALSALGRSAEAAAGPGHWVHAAEVLHITLRTLEPYRSVVPPGDARLRGYGEALDAAASGLPAVRMRLSGVSPHAGGVLVLGHPLDDTIWRLQRRYMAALPEGGRFEERVRDLWYVSLVHFAGPLARPERLVDWCDAHADLDLGVVEAPTVEIVHAVHDGPGLSLRSLHRTALGA
jgi:hypothetical protein